MSDVAPVPLVPSACKVVLDLRGVKDSGDAYCGTATISFTPSEELGAAADHDAPPLCAEAVGWAPTSERLMAHVDTTFVTIEGATVVQGKRTTKVASIDRAHAANIDLLAFRPATPVTCDFGASCDLVIRFTSKAAPAGSMHGLYVIKAHGIITSFFEVTHARKAFPCVDAPALKVPFELSVQTRADATLVLGNTPLVEAKKSGDGSQTFRFAPTGAIPAYTYGFFCAACPMQVLAETLHVAALTCTSEITVAVHATKSSRFPVAVAFAALRTSVALLSDFFGAPLPHGKLDCVIVPQMPIGGMEHDGLIFINEDVGVKKAGAAAKAGDEPVIQLVVHEVAHQWLGNLVGLPFAVKEGLCQVLELCIGDLVAGKPMRKFNSTAVGAGAAGQKGGAAPREVTVAEGRELTGLTYQHAFNSMQAYVATVGWEAFRDALRRLIDERRDTYVTQAEFDHYIAP